MSHVVPDLVQKIVKGQDPLHILGDGTQIRHYSYGGDLARGIVTAMEHPNALNEDFNISTDESTTVLELAEKIWRRIKGAEPFRYVSDQPFAHDVQRRCLPRRRRESCWPSRPRRRSTRCWTRSCLGSSTPSNAA
jgi:UDP-glucose 4-epimerase